MATIAKKQPVTKLSERKHLTNKLHQHFNDVYDFWIASNLNTNFLKYDHYGLDVVEITNDHKLELYNDEVPVNGSQYAITDSEEKLHSACKKYIRENIWAFRAEWLVDYIPTLTADDIRIIQGEHCEDCNEIIFKLVEDFEELVEDAIEQDGIGHFIAFQDGEVQEWRNGLFVIEV